MKITIRQGVFETNSSSMHALALQKGFTDNCEICKEKYKNMIPENIVLDIYGEADSIDSSRWDEKTKSFKDLTGRDVIVEKIKLVLKNIIYRLDRDDFSCHPYRYNISVLFVFLNWLTKLGITYRFIDTDDCYGETTFEKGMWVSGAMADELWEKLFDGTEETFCNFLFGDGSRLDSYATDCIYGDYDKFVDKFEKDMKNHGKCDLFQHYGG